MDREKQAEAYLPRVSKTLDKKNGNALEPVEGVLQSVILFPYAYVM